MDRWKSRGGKSQRREEKRRKKIREEKESEERRCRCAKKSKKVAKHCVFQLICGTRGSKSRLAKAARAEASRQMRDEKLHAAVARSTFRSENVQNRPTAEHFLKVVMWKSARRCGAKRMWKEKV